MLRTLAVVLVLAGCGPSGTGLTGRMAGDPCAQAERGANSCSSDRKQLLLCEDAGWSTARACQQTDCCYGFGKFGCDVGGQPAKCPADGGWD